MSVYSSLQENRLHYQPEVPKALQELTSIDITADASHTQTLPEIANLFPQTSNNKRLTISNGQTKQHAPLRVGVVLSGGQAAGGHNVIWGLFEALKQLNKESLLFGFSDGPAGILNNKHISITAELLASYRNQGGFDLIGAGRDKIESTEQLKAAEKTMQNLNLDGLVIIGGDDSNTNAAFLSEYFKSVNCKTSVIGVPKTIDGDLKNDDIEISFGFDTACKVYSEIIGNLLRDALSAKKYYYFIKLMGRSASHIALECALQTHPNLTLISEEVAAKQQTLHSIVVDICNLITERSKVGKDFGVILIPEGLIEFIPEVKTLIRELNILCAQNLSEKEIHSKLSQESLNCLHSLPKDIQEQLLLTRDAHGNVQVSKIETERLLIDMVKKELKMRSFSGKINSQPFFCGYEGRSALPSNFDSRYCYALGLLAGVLINAKATGYICSLKNLSQPVENWLPQGIPLTHMLTLEQRHGKSKAVIQKALVDLKGHPFKQLSQYRSQWALQDDYIYPGPIQFFGPNHLTDAISFTLQLESR